MRLGADRGTGIVAVGGGVLGDSAGFAAASFLRGLALAQVPTTLLAQVDSSVGGKVGVNHPLGKNLIGAFHQPRLVAVDPLVLETLPRREFRAGLYEVVKYGMTSSRDLFDRVNGQVSKIFRRSPEVMTPIIAESCRIKADVVAADEREGGIRRVLNFGHTAGHALEAVTKYKRLRHGEAVAYGMLVASELSVARGRMPADDLAGSGRSSPSSESCRRSRTSRPRRSSRPAVATRKSSTARCTSSCAPGSDRGRSPRTSASRS